MTTLYGFNCRGDLRPHVELPETEPLVLSKWAQLEERLSGVFGSAKAVADGYELYFVKRLSGERLVIETYVDGFIKGEWCKVEDGEPVHPEGRFWRPCRSRVFPLKQHAALRRAFGKRKADKMTRLRTVAVVPTWNTPRALVRHLKKHFPDLELVADQPGGDA